jgi:hypothetical protein
MLKCCRHGVSVRLFSCDARSTKKSPKADTVREERDLSSQVIPIARVSAYSYSEGIKEDVVRLRQVLCCFEIPLLGRQSFLQGTKVRILAVI